VLEPLETGGVERWDVPYAGLVNVVSWTRALDRAPLLRLRAVMCGGEQLQVTDDLADWFRALPGCGLVNQYGPSEVSRATSHWLPADPGEWPVLPPIGRPADNTAVHVLDATGEPVPPGFPGEVWISGANLARGYVNRPDLTADRFYPDTVSAVPGARLYRTGDLARYSTAGQLEFLGRVDTQVKLRGHRVELGEIEAALQRLPAVSAAAVAVQGTGVTKGLIAYLVLAEGAQAPSPGEVAQALAERLPDYMVPGRFTVLDRLPLTASGKLDRRNLPEVNAIELSTQDFVAPAGEHEVRVSAMWAELLGRAGVGATDNFFALGGHSLLATEFVARLHEEAGVSVRISALFENPTVRRFCATVAWTGPEPDEPRVRRLPRRGRTRATHPANEEP
jgi:non-ribosomal peptide synthetase component E (peptide arylation enzyme)